MKFLKFLIIIAICFIVIPAFGYISAGGKSNLYMFFGVVFLIWLAWMIFWSVKKHRDRRKFPGGAKGARLQGIWVLEKHLRFDPVLKKWETVPVEDEKNYFEFKGSNFHSGDFDEKHKQLPADYSPFSVEGDNIIFESEFLKKGNWKWAVKNGKLELTGETVHPDSKSQFIFYRKNWR